MSICLSLRAGRGGAEGGARDTGRHGVCMASRFHQPASQAKTRRIGGGRRTVAMEKLVEAYTDQQAQGSAYEIYRSL